ncbi:hypothetical protein DER45DRAFT_585241 [Fusarium avenaceum]|nr:hypothetical protein DER45DRAFT_585241 [Fusarium avenaceum]
MDDAVRISAERFRFVYEEGFKTWARLYADVVEKPGFPAQLFAAIQDVCQRHPILSRRIRLEIDQGGAFATGNSIWSSNGTTLYDIMVAVRKPVSLSLSHSSEGQNTEVLRFTRDQDYVSILILAWTYILSARWTETMPGTCSLAYTESRAAIYHDMTQCEEERHLISIQLGDVSPQETRWWAAVLAPGQGWQANMAYEQQIFLAPWSIRLQQDFRVALLHMTDPVPLHSAATFSDASQYLDRFCVQHDITDQSQASLASVLLLPSMGSLKCLRLPLPRGNITIPSRLASNTSDEKLNHDWTHQRQHIDKLITLSCNTRGILPLLLSVFYEPRIECNAVTPWLQGTLAAIKHVAGNNAYVVGHMYMERSPRLAFLWLGCIVLGLQDKILQGVHFGQIPIDIHSAAWSGTVQSFIQQRVSNPLTTDGCISRADECRLLFLSQSEGHVRIPVRVHHQCEDHWLQYKGIDWECEDGNLEFQSSQNEGSRNDPGESLVRQARTTSVEVSHYAELDQDREAISENATRSIFGWLRLDGYTKGERNIWNHEWFDMSESDDDMDGDENTSIASAQLSSRGRTNALVSSASLSEHDIAQLAQLRETKGSTCG